MTAQINTQRNKSGEHKRPSVLALLLLFIGAWASIATSPAESSVQETGEHVIAAGQPVAQLSWEATSDKSMEWVTTDLWLELVTETGKQAELSIGFPDDAQGQIDSAPALAVNNMSPTGTVELVVTNPTETGDVTMNWNMTARVEEDQAELGLTTVVDAANGPSARLLLPEHRWTYFGSSRVATVYTIVATTPAAGADQPLTIETEPLVNVDQQTGVVTSMTVDGAPAELADRTVIPWADGCGDVCTREVELVLTAPPAMTIDSGSADGTVTVVAREPFQSEPAWVEFKPFPALSEERVYILDIGLASGGPLDQQVVLTSELVESMTDFGCVMEVSYRSTDGQWGPETNYLESNWNWYHPALLQSGGGSVEVTIGPGAVTEECEVDRSTEFTARVGIITYGLTPPVQATVNVR